MHFRTSSSAAFNAPFVPDRVLNNAWKARACCPPRHERLFHTHTAPSSFRHFSRAVCVANIAAKFEQNPVTIFVFCWSKRSSSQSRFVLLLTVSDALCLFCLRWAGLKRIKCKVSVQSEEEVLLCSVIVFWFVVEGNTLLALYSVEWQVLFLDWQDQGFNAFWQAFRYMIFDHSRSVTVQVVHSSSSVVFFFFLTRIVLFLFYLVLVIIHTLRDVIYWYLHIFNKYFVSYAP